MFGVIRVNFNSKAFAFIVLASLIVAIPRVARAGHGECSFTVVPVHACVISFYKLLAAPEKYNEKYISIIGYMDISDGRLAVYPTKLSYDLAIEQDSFTIKEKMDKMEYMASQFGSGYVRLVGVFHYAITGDYSHPGVGNLSKIIGIDKVATRPDIPQDHNLKFDVQGIGPGPK